MKYERVNMERKKKLFLHNCANNKDSELHLAKRARNKIKAVFLV